MPGELADVFWLLGIEADPINGEEAERDARTVEGRCLTYVFRATHAAHP